MSNNHHEENIDVIGEVTMVCVSRPRMAIQLPEGREIESVFRADDEEVVTTALRQHKTAKLRIIGRGELDAHGQVQRITEVRDAILMPNGQGKSTAAVKPIWEKFAEIASDIPESDLQRLPVDSSARLDEYLYGNTKDD